MTIKKQLSTIKENWLLVVALLVLVMVPMFSSTGSIGSADYAKGLSYQTAGESLAAPLGSYYSRGSDDFAPEVEDRQITKTANLQTEIERGTFEAMTDKLKAIITSSDSYLLNENVQKYGFGWKEYFRGSYQIKIAADKYDAVIAQLKEIGEVTSFNENAQDITGRYTDLQSELNAEKGRLQRYQSMYHEATRVEDKITLSDRIYNQERRIKYLEDSINNLDKRVEYSTVHFTMNEERSEYAGVALVKLSELVRAFIGSLNNLFYLVFWAIPYAVTILLVMWIRRLIKRRR